MSEHPDPDQDQQAAPPPPMTGHHVIDATLAELREASPVATGQLRDGSQVGSGQLRDGSPVAPGQLVELSELPAAEQHDRLAAALDVLSSVLESSRDQAQAPIPGVR